VEFFNTADRPLNCKHWFYRGFSVAPQPFVRPHDCFRCFLGFSLVVALLTPVAIGARGNRSFSVT
jgi:hypothetical protein